MSAALIVSKQIYGMLVFQLHFNITNNFEVVDYHP